MVSREPQSTIHLEATLKCINQIVNEFKITRMADIDVDRLKIGIFVFCLDLRYIWVLMVERTTMKRANSVMESIKVFHITRNYTVRQQEGS